MPFTIARPPPLLATPLETRQSVKVTVPATSRTAPPYEPLVGALPLSAQLVIDAVPPFLSEPYGKYIQFVLPVSFAHTPAISVPAGLHDHLPVGVQLVARAGREMDLLNLAEQLEAMPGFGFQRPPDFG